MYIVDVNHDNHAQESKLLSSCFANTYWKNNYGWDNTKDSYKYKFFFYEANKGQYFGFAYLK